MPPNYAFMLKNGLKRAFNRFLGHSLAQSADSFIQGVYFIHFIDGPCAFLPVPTKNWIPVAVNTESDARVL